MAQATAPSRIVLQDRWDAVMEPNRNGGNATDEYIALTSALHDLMDKVAGHEIGEEYGVEGVDDDTLFAVGLVVIDEVMRKGLAR
jgi:hypothetical protein